MVVGASRVICIKVSGFGLQCVARYLIEALEFKDGLAISPGVISQIDVGTNIMLLSHQSLTNVIAQTK